MSMASIVYRASARCRQDRTREQGSIGNFFAPERWETHDHCRAYAYGGPLKLWEHEV